MTTQAVRRRARELALQALYMHDVQPELDAGTVLARYYRSFPGGPDEESEAPGPRDPSSDEEVRRYAERIVRGVAERQAELDGIITVASRNWRLERMARVDRNLLRMAAFEMVALDDVPGKVAINEAIEIAKRYGAAETPAFVNGVLDRILDGRSARSK